MFLMAQFEIGWREEHGSNLRMSCYIRPTRETPSITSAVFLWCSFYRLSYYRICHPSTPKLWAIDEPVVTREAHLAALGRKTSQEMAHTRYTLPEAENWLAVDGREDVASMFFSSHCLFSRVLSPSTEAQMLVHQGEQSHVIGCFPTWAPDSTMLITNWWEIH